jgi:hypothetical protein
MGLFKRNVSSPTVGQQEFAGAHSGGLGPLVVRRGETRPDVIAKLEVLDDVIFAAIDGDATALQASAGAWHSAVDELGHDTLEETRRQYLRHAQSVWDALRHQPVQPPHRIFAAIEIIGLLVNHEQ